MPGSSCKHVALFLHWFAEHELSNSQESPVYADGQLHIYPDKLPIRNVGVPPFLHGL